MAQVYNWEKPNRVGRTRLTLHVPAADSAPSEPLCRSFEQSHQNCSMTKTRLKRYSLDRIQSSSETIHGREKYKAAQKQYMEGRNTKQLRNNTWKEEIQSSSETTHGTKGKNSRDKNWKRRKPRRCNTVKAKVVAHTKENSG